jgi:NAD(P)-dependent dehydrogenase (short-subunit alcohol dehydrogenase family)
MGREIARWLASAGAAVVCAARSAAELEKLGEEIRSGGGEALPVSLDVSKPEQCKDAVQRAFEAFGRIDGLVNNAGVLDPVAPLADADPDQWQHNVAVNLLGPFYLIRAALPCLRATRGKIINISTGAAVKAIEGWSAYCAAKAGFAHLSRVLAAEEQQITAVSLRPGVVDTVMQERIRQVGPKMMPPQKAAYFQDLKDSGRLEAPSVPARSAA